jgi:hypothetical protein
MAFRNYLVSVPLAAVEAVRDGRSDVLTSSLTVSVSHLIAYWVQVQPLGRLLGQAVDGGAVLNNTLRHQLRDPCYHDPDAVRSQYVELSNEWQRTTSAHPVEPDDWYRIEIEKVLRVFAHAAERGECVVSALEPCTGIQFKSDN